MTDTPPPAAGPPPTGGRPRRPPTIDLTATEIAADTGAEAVATTAGGAGADVPPGPTGESPAGSTGAGPAGPGSPDEPPAGPDSQRFHLATVVPMLAAGAAGAVLALALIWGVGLIPRQDGGTSALEGRLARLERQVGELAAQPAPTGGDARALEEVRGRLAKLETAAPRTGAGDSAFANRIAAVEGEVKALAESVGILGRRNDEAMTAVRDARQRADSSVAAVAELTPKVAAAPAMERGELDALADRVAAVERGEKAVEAGDRGLRLALTAAALRAAVESGGGFAAELAAMKAFGGDPKLTAPLEPFASSGVPSAAMLARELSAMVPTLLAASGATPREGGFLERLQANAEKLVRVRPVDETTGSDPAAIMARIEIRATQADIAGALAELAKLPEPARAPAVPWIRKVEMRNTALESARRLAGDALTGLGK